MGTSRPALYHVLHDENSFSSDDIQQLTYWVCILIIHRTNIIIDFYDSFVIRMFVVQNQSRFRLLSIMHI